MLGVGEPRGATDIDRGGINVGMNVLRFACVLVACIVLAPLLACSDDAAPASSSAGNAASAGSASNAGNAANAGNTGSAGSVGTGAGTGAGTSASPAAGAGAGNAGSSSIDVNASDAGANPARDARVADTGATPITVVDAGLTRSGCKRGVAYGHHSQADMQALSGAVSWWYNWGHLPDEGVRNGAFRDLRVEYVPMTWNGAFDVDTLVNEIPLGTTHLLGFNEPNFGAQANLTAQQAADRWPAVEAIADARDLRLVSPAVNYCGGDCRDTDPFHYLHEFLDACDGCRIDAIAIHIYVGCNAQWLIDHVEHYKAEFDQPLWLTEFACDSAASFEEQRDFMQDAVAYLEGEPRIERYAWFAGRADNVPFVDLLAADGELTILGQTYTTLPQSPACQP